MNANRSSSTPDRASAERKALPGPHTDLSWSQKEPSLPLSPPSEALSVHLEALWAYSEALPAHSEALSAPAGALPAPADALPAPPWSLPDRRAILWPLIGNAGGA